MFLINNILRSFHYQKIFEDVFTGDGFGGRVVGMKQTLLTICLIIIALSLEQFNKADANSLTIEKRFIATKGDVFTTQRNPFEKKGYWKFSYSMNYWKDHMIKEVTDNIRLGDTALRFELRPGDCGGKGSNKWDCNNRSERHEIINVDKEGESINHKGEYWHSISFYLADGHEDLLKGKLGHNSIIQFHNDGDWAPMFNWSVGKDVRNKKGLYLQRRTGCNTKRIYEKHNAKGNQGCSVSWEENNLQLVMKLEDGLLRKWHDVVFNTNFTSREDGFLKMWINGKLVYHYKGPIIPKRLSSDWSNSSGMQFGIYRSADHGWYKVTQVNYYDEIRIVKKKCIKLKLEDLGYSCKELESQEINSIDTLDNANWANY